MKKFILFIFVILICGIKANANPNELYNAAWKTLSDNYYDKTMNHQDWNKWKTKYHNLTTYEDAYLAIDSMTESLNEPYTIFLKPQIYNDELLDMDGKEIKFGIFIKKIKEKYYIIPTQNGAAQKAGIKKNDILLEINGKSVTNISAGEFVSAFNTDKKEGINLLIKRGKEEKNYKIFPEELHTISIVEKPYFKTNIPKNIKYFRILSFMNKTLAKQFQDILDSYEDKFDGYVIDVRGNTGGIAKNAAVMANMLLRDKVILSMVDRDGNKKVINSNDDTMTDKPVVVLCDRDSASASEIFVAAIKDNKRGIIIGEKTYGKGIMQDVFKLPDDCGMNITVEYYLTPADEFIHGKGIEPDINIKNDMSNRFKRNDKTLKQAIKILEEIIQKNTAEKL